MLEVNHDAGCHQHAMASTVKHEARQAVGVAIDKLAIQCSEVVPCGAWVLADEEGVFLCQVVQVERHEPGRSKCLKLADAATHSGLNTFL